MKSAANILRPNKEKITILVVLVLLWAAINAVSFAGAEYYNVNYGLQGRSEIPLALESIMDITNFLALPLQMVSMIAFFPLCPYFGDSDAATRGCGGPLPEAVSIVLYYLFQAIILYLVAVAWITIKAKTLRKTSEHKKSVSLQD